jgi:hypothetical protein
VKSITFASMTTEEIKLNVGDRLYYFQYGIIGHTITIDRVTDKTAWSDRTKFKREQGCNHYIRSIGSGSYSGHYRLETPEILAEYGLKLKRRKAIEGFEKLAKACQSADEETLNKYLQFIESLEK